MSLNSPAGYPFQPISLLSPGPQRVCFQGLITNITSYSIASKSSQAAKGCFKILLRDEASEILVKLWYADRTYDMQLCQVMKVSTTHISPMTSTTTSESVTNTAPARVTTSVFPERDSGCSVEIVQLSQSVPDHFCHRLCQTGLMELDKFFQDDHSTDSVVKLLVMVLHVGMPTTIKTKANTEFEVLELNVIDHSSLGTASSTHVIPAYLSLNSSLFNSVTSFIPKHTVLLISNPSMIHHARRKFKLTPRSQVLINPPIAEVALLRNWTRCLFPALPSVKHGNVQTQCLCEEVLTDIRNKQTQNLLPRKQYTLALFLDEIDLRRQREATRPKYRHQNPLNLSFIGYISVIVSGISLVSLYDMQKLFCGVCQYCNAEIFANSPSTTHSCCTVPQHIPTEQSHTLIHNILSSQPAPVSLSWNPSILTGLADESGGFFLANPDERHNIALTDQAVHGLIGLSVEDFAAVGASTVGSASADPSESVTQRSSDRNGKASNREGMYNRLLWIEAQLR